MGGSAGWQAACKHAQRTTFCKKVKTYLKWDHLGEETVPLLLPLNLLQNFSIQFFQGLLSLPPPPLAGWFSAEHWAPCRALSLLCRRSEICWPSPIPPANWRVCPLPQRDKQWPYIKYSFLHLGWLWETLFSSKDTEKRGRGACSVCVHSNHGLVCLPLETTPFPWCPQHQTIKVKGSHSDLLDLGKGVWGVDVFLFGNQPETDNRQLGQWNRPKLSWENLELSSYKISDTLFLFLCLLVS